MRIPGEFVAMSISSSSRSVAAMGADDYGRRRLWSGQRSSEWTYFSQRYREFISLLTLGSAPDTRTMNPRASRRNVCPHKEKQDSHDYISHRPCDVRWLRPALPLLVRLQDHVARAPSALAVCRRYSRLCRQTQATSLEQILIVLNRWDATAVSGIHPFEITDVFKRPPDNLAEPTASSERHLWLARMRRRVATSRSN